MSGSVTLKVDGMSCKSCVAKVEKALQTIDGINQIKIDLEAGKAKVKYSEVSPNESDLVKVIKEAGFEASVI